MFSKSLMKSFILPLLLPALLLVGCDRFLREKNKSSGGEAPDTVNQNMKSVECLKVAPKMLQSFFNDEADANALADSVTCIQNSLKEFQRLTRGSQAEGYQGKEIQFFFNRYLLSEAQITEAFQKEIFKLKVVVVGGSPDFVTRHELQQFSEFLGEIQKEVQKFQGNMKLVFFSRNSSTVDPKELSKLKENLQSLGEFFLARTQLSSSRYQWVDLIAFLKELNHFMGEPGSLTTLLKWVPLAESIKVVFLGENAKLVSAQEWSAAQTWAVSTYMTTLHFFYEIKDHELRTPSEWKTLMGLLDGAFTAIETAPAMREKKILEAQAFDRLIDEVFKLELFQTVVTPDLLKTTYRKALVHFIETPTGRGEPITIDGLTETHLKILKQEYHVWKLSQVFLNEKYSANPQQSLQTLKQAYSQFAINPTLASFSLSALEREEVTRSWQDFGMILASQPSVAYTGKLKTLIAPGADSKTLSFVGANMMNSVRSYVRLAHRGYGERRSKNLFENRLPMNGLVNLQEDFYEFAVKIGFVDPREKDSAVKIFREGNFFTYHGNGDDWLTSLETYELLSTLISGGRTQLGEIYQDLKERNCLLSDLDVFGKPKVQEPCFAQLMHERKAAYFDHMPAMLRFMTALNPSQWDQFYRGLMVVAKGKFNPPNVLDSAEIRTVTTMLNFIESIFMVYDRDQNMMLSESETLAASPRFRAYIASISPLKTFMADDIFLYLVFKGEKPSEGMLAGVAELAAFKAERLFGLGEVSRMNLIQLLAVLKDNVH